MESSNPVKLGEVVLQLKSKDLIKVDPGDGEDFYAYDLIPFVEAYLPPFAGSLDPIEVYVKVTPQATSEYHEMQVGQKFRLVPTK